MSFNDDDMKDDGDMTMEPGRMDEENEGGEEAPKSGSEGGEDEWS